jgi:hypothetical protein
MKRNLRTVLVLLLVFALAASAVYAKPSDPLGREACTLAEVASCSNNLHQPTRIVNNASFFDLWGTIFGGPVIGTHIGSAIGSHANDDDEDDA